MAESNISYIIEAKRYSVNELEQETGFTPSMLKDLPLNTIKSKEGKYWLNFVGLIARGDKLVVVLPKYLLDRKKEDWEISDYSYNKEAQLIMNVLRVYLKRQENKLTDPDKDIDANFNGETLTAINLIDHFREYGYWNKMELVLTNQGVSETNWQRTIDNNIPLISDGSVIYPDLFSYKRNSYSGSIILQIHRWAVHYCIEKYCSLLQEFQYVQYDADVIQNCEDLGSTEYLTSVLENELLISYRDSDITLLSLLIQLLDEQAEGSDESIQLFGTNAFHVVWENACKSAFGDQTEKYNKQIETPEWNSKDGNVFRNVKNRLIPDIIWSDERHLLIADAKYYKLKFSGTEVRNNPEISDVTKQIVYKEVVRKLPGINGEIELNAFIFPQDDIYNKAERPEDWLWGWIDSKILPNSEIAVILIPPHEIYKCYLHDKPLIAQKEFITKILKMMPSSGLIM